MKLLLLIPGAIIAIIGSSVCNKLLVLISFVPRVSWLFENTLYVLPRLVFIP